MKLKNKDREEAFALLVNMWKKIKDINPMIQSIKSSTPRGSMRDVLAGGRDEETEQEDWKLILKGAQKLSFQVSSPQFVDAHLFTKENFVILKEGDEYQKIYQISKGTCKYSCGLDRE